MLILGLLLLLTCASAQCFCRQQKQVNPNNPACDNGLGPCGSPSSTGFVHCCHPGDACGADGFCHFRITLTGTSGYYLGGCTDPTFLDPSCPRQCTDLSTQDVVYNRSTDLWACCWNSAEGSPDCSNPTRETFEAPAPEDLFSASWASVTATNSIPVKSNVASSSSILTQTGTSAESTTSTQSGTSTERSASPTPITNPSSTSLVVSPTQTKTEALAGTSSDLSTEAKAGIGMGVSVAFVASLGVLLFFFGQRLRNRHQDAVQPNQQGRITYEMSAYHRYEAPSNHRQKIVHEMNASHIYEVTGNNYPTY